MALNCEKTINIYFVANPLHYLAAKAIASNIETQGKQILVWYKPELEQIVEKEKWDIAFYMPWPRLDPLPGFCGRIKRQLQNIELIGKLVKYCDTLNIHSAVFDTEAINYFLHALPNTCNIKQLNARIIPDGLLNTRRHPLSLSKRLLQYFKKLRLLYDKRLSYSCFSGDRIGSDAPFCDRIYVLHGLPNQYPPEKTVTLPSILNTNNMSGTKGKKRALVVGQPLTGFNLASAANMHSITTEINLWLNNHGYSEIDYKSHPKDPNKELFCPEYNELQLSEPLETWMSKTEYDVIAGVHSTVLLLSKLIYGSKARALAFGLDRIKFKSNREQSDIINTFNTCGIEIISPVSHRETDE